MSHFVKSLLTLTEAVKQVIDAKRTSPDATTGKQERFARSVNGTKEFTVKSSPEAGRTRIIVTIKHEDETLLNALFEALDLLPEIMEVDRYAHDPNVVRSTGKITFHFLAG